MIDNKKSGKMDGFVRIVDHPDLEYYEQRFMELEARVLKIEKRLKDLEQILMLGES